MTTTPLRTSADGEPAAPRRPRLRRALGIGIAVVLAVGGMLGVRHWDAGMAAGLADALASLETAGAELASSVADGEAVLAESDGNTTDEAHRTALADALDAASRDLAVGPGSRAEQTNRAAELASDALAHAARVRDATAAVRADVAAWQLAQAVSARSAALVDLDAGIASGAELLAGTEGRVLPDDGPREALRVALDAATALRDADADLADVAAVTASTGRIDEAGVALGDAVAGVTAGHEAWQAAEAQRVAGEQAAAAAAARGSTGSGSASGGSGAKRGTGSGGASAPAGRPGSGGSASAGGSGGGYWVDEGYVDGPGGCVMADQHGNSWSC